MSSCNLFQVSKFPKQDFIHHVGYYPTFLKVWTPTPVLQKEAGWFPEDNKVLIKVPDFEVGILQQKHKVKDSGIEKNIVVILFKIILEDSPKKIIFGITVLRKYYSLQLNVRVVLHVGKSLASHIFGRGYTAPVALSAYFDVSVKRGLFPEAREE